MFVIFYIIGLLYELFYMLIKVMPCFVGCMHQSLFLHLSCELYLELNSKFSPNCFGHEPIVSKA